MYRLQTTFLALLMVFFSNAGAQALSSPSAIQGTAGLPIRPQQPPLWTVQIDPEGIGSRVTTNEETVFAVHSGTLTAYRLSDGHILWQQAGNFKGPLSADSTMLYVISGQNSLEAREVKHGALRWKVHLSALGSGMPETITITSKVLILNGGSGAVGLSSEDGKLRWSRASSDNHGPLHVVGGVGVWTFNQPANSALVGVDLLTGRTRWMLSGDMQPLAAEGSFLVTRVHSPKALLRWINVQSGDSVRVTFDFSRSGLPAGAPRQLWSSLVSTNAVCSTTAFQETPWVACIPRLSGQYSGGNKALLPQALSTSGEFSSLEEYCTRLVFPVGDGTSWLLGGSLATRVNTPGSTSLCFFERGGVAFFGVPGNSVQPTGSLSAFSLETGREIRRLEPVLLQRNLFLQGDRLVVEGDSTIKVFSWDTIR